MNKAFFIFFCFLFSFAEGQNLVLNPSFEDYYSCPIGPSMFDSCKNVFNPIDNSVAISTPDYFNSCSSFTTNASVPTNFFGYQVPYHGNAYSGIFISIANYQEYIQMKFKKPLDAGKIYSFGFFVSLANRCRYATSNIDVKFTKDSVLYPSTPLENFLTPDWKNPIGNFLTDTLSWKELKGEYSAKGGELWLIIGCFRGTNNVDTIAVNQSQTLDAYYLIDYVTVESILDLDNLNIPNVFTPNDDGINDVWYLNLKGFSNINCNVYNRWGLNVYESNTSIINWDGHTSSGEPCSEGIYYYVINCGDQKTFKGFIQLVR